MSVGAKFDDGKQRWYAMPLEVLEPLADVFNYGESLYETFNCLSPFEDSNSRFWNATMRHLEACQRDPLARNEEDGHVFHAAQAAFNILMRLHHAIKEDEDAKRGIDRTALKTTSDIPHVTYVTEVRNENKKR
jgi:hypothetical protein